GSSPQIGHEYQKSGTVSVSMTATFSGEFSVDGGPWLPIDGFAHVASSEIGIDVYRYHPISSTRTATRTHAAPTAPEPRARTAQPRTPGFGRPKNRTAMKPTMTSPAGTHRD